MSAGHVCVYTTAHPVDDVRVNSRMADAFLAAGYEVSWVGPENSYFTDSTTPDERIRYRLFRPNVSRARRLLASRAAEKQARTLDGVDWWYCPDPDAAASAVRVAARRGGRVIFDVHEVFHGALMDRWFPGRPPALARDLVRRRISRTCRRADLVIGVNDSVLAPYLAPEAPRLVVRNCAPNWFGPVEGVDRRTATGPGDKLRVMHGKAIPSNGTTTVVDAVARLSQTERDAFDIHMTRPGRRPSAFLMALQGRLASEPEGSAISMHDGIPHEQMPELLGGYDVGMIAYGRALGIDSLPNRLFEYLAAGLAVLAPSYAVEIVRIIDAEGVGVTADFEDPEDVARALRWLQTHRDEVREMGERARRAYTERYNWQVEVGRLISRMRSVVDA